MKIIQITPGAGADYNCDNCLRDTALVWALKQAGHDVRMITLYLPPKADRPEELDGDPEIYFGGINVYLQQKSWLFRHTPRWVDWLFDRPLWLRWAAGVSGMTDPDDLAETALSMLRGTDGRQRKELDRLVARLRDLDRPDVVLLSNPLIGGLASRIKSELGVPVACLLQDEDAFLDDLGDPAAERVWSLLAERCGDIDGFVAVSEYYAGEMRRRVGLDGSIHVVHNGLHSDGYEMSEAVPDPPVLGFLSPMSERWGLDRIVEAWRLLREREELKRLRLHVAGSKLHSDAPFVDAVVETIGGDENESVSVIVDPDRRQRIELLRGMSVLAVPSRKGEAFGKFVLEAWAAGVPVVLPEHGAFPELVGATGGGVLHDPDDVGSVVEAVAALLADPDRARELGRAGRQAVGERFSLERSADGMVEALARIIDGA